MNATPEYLQIESPALRLSYCVVPWDTEALGFCVAHISRIELGTGDPTADFEPFEQWCRQASAGLVSCRLPHGRLRESAWLESRGFRFIEMVCRPKLDLQQPTPPAAVALAIAPIAASDLAVVEGIAAIAFSTGRFLLDPALDRGLSAQRYRHWVRTSFANPHHQVLKAEIDGAIAGFFVVEPRSDGTAYWHLTAIAPGFQNRGIGKALWLAMLARHRQAGMLAVETTVSMHNTAVLNLYARLGFRFSSAEMTFHCTDIR